METGNVVAEYIRDQVGQYLETRLTDNTQFIGQRTLFFELKAKLPDLRFSRQDLVCAACLAGFVKFRQHGEWKIRRADRKRMTAKYGNPIIPDDIRHLQNMGHQLKFREVKNDPLDRSGQQLAARRMKIADQTFKFLKGSDWVLRDAVIAHLQEYAGVSLMTPNAFSRIINKDPRFYTKKTTRGGRHMMYVKAKN